MPLKRVTPTLPGLPRVAVAAGTIPAFASPRGGGGPATSEVIDLGPLAATIAGHLRQEARRKGQDEAQLGQAFVRENPALVAELEAQAAAVGGEDDLEDLRETFRQLIDSGRVPEAASPFFQIGFIEQRARQKASDVRANLIARLPELTRVDDEEEPPDIAQVLAEAFGEAAGSPVVQNVYGREAFNGARSQVEEEIRRRFDEGRTAGITAQHRSLFRDSVGAAVAQVAIVDPGDVPGALARVQDVAEGEGRARSIRDVRGVLVEAVEAEAANLAVGDVDRAIFLVRRAREISINGRSLGHQGTVSASMLNQLIHELDNQREEQQRSENDTVSSNLNRALAVAQGLSTKILFEARRDPARTIQSSVPEALAAVRASEEIREVLGLGADEALPDDFEGLVIGRIQTAKRSLLDDAGVDDPELVEQLEVDIRRGVRPETLREEIGELIGNGITPRTAERLLSGLESNEDFQEFISEPGSPYQSLVGQLTRSSILPGFSEAAKTRLNDALFDAETALHDHVLSQVQAAGNAPAERRAAFDRAIRGPEARAFVRDWRGQVEAAAAAYASSLRTINDHLAGFRVDEARTAINDAQKAGTINGDQYDKFLRDVLNTEAERDHLLAAGADRAELEREVRGRVSRILSARPELAEDPGAVDDAAEAAALRAGEEFVRIAEGKDLSSSAQATSLREAREEAVAAALERFTPAERPTITTIEDVGLAALAAPERLGLIQTSYGADARLTRSEVFSDARIEALSDELYARVDEIGDDPFFGSRAALEQEILSEWDFAVLGLGADLRDNAWVSLHGQHEIPFEMALGQQITTEYKNASRAEVRMIDNRAAGILLGARGQNFFNESDIERMTTVLSEHGVEVIAGAREPFDGFRPVTLRATFKIGRDVPLSPWGTRYFDRIGQFDALDRATKERFLTRVGLSTEDERAFLESSRKFRDDQEAVILDWQRRKGLR